ncbi:cysteine hydrolase family protein [Puia dinghuensis]|uniref:Isochorismatase n=1 Tax=Puia dinghuensis TaxID=1792502 RepID=A0A8J2UC44_9BACT|nr:cysteine hydrolase [Puia dinghuensis]GGA97095.1 isochorismatase [Puia dinghuensis]
MEKNSQALATALLVMDIQSPTMTMVGENASALIATLKQAIAAARKSGIPVFYVVVGFRKGYPELSPYSKMAPTIKSGALGNLEDPTVDPALGLQPEDIVITKRRLGAFSGSDLDVLLRANRIYNLVLAGIATSGVVLSTYTEAIDKDYLVTILSDGCADRDPEVHNVLLGKVFPRRADVLTTEQWIAGLNK